MWHWEEKSFSFWLQHFKSERKRRYSFWLLCLLAPIPKTIALMFIIPDSHSSQTKERTKDCSGQSSSFAQQAKALLDLCIMLLHVMGRSLPAAIAPHGGHNPPAPPASWLWPAAAVGFQQKTPQAPSAPMGPNCSEQPQLGPPPTPSAQQLYLSSVLGYLKLNWSLVLLSG